MKTINSYFAVLDIETSSLFETEYKNGVKIQIPKAVWLAYGYINLYNAKGKKVDSKFFREWSELDDYLHYMAISFSGKKIITFCHNLAYEFDFLIKNISRPEKMLSNSTHKVISTTLKSYKNIEFRCSYQLSGYSLKKVGDIVGLPKLESEYRTIYPEDDITTEEKEYCDRDCDIVAKYISEIILKEYTFLSHIPLTKTGRVRLVLKDYYLDNKDVKDWDLMPPEDCYYALTRAFNGGLAIVNPIFTNRILNNVHCYDITSSYPFAMLAEQFPYSIYKVQDKKDFNINNKFWIAKVKYNNINAKYSWGWLSISKMENCSYNSEYFNGKLLYSETVERYVTNIDFDLIKKTYNYSSFEILEFYNCDKYGNLPKPYIDTIKKFATLKGELKIKLKELEKQGKSDRELEKDYMLAKNDFNSIYGMTVQHLMNKEYTINENFEWEVIEQEYKQNQNKHLRRNFLFGIYVTAYARRNLLLAILKNCPCTFVYSDTDSIKFVGNNIFIDTNKRLVDYAENIHVKDLGKFDYEGTYDEFINLGAKKYCYTKNGKIDMVVAGLPKSESILNIKEFKCGIEFFNCKLATKYYYENKIYELDDEEKLISSYQNEELSEFYEKHNIKTRGGAILYPTSYKLDMTLSDKAYLKEIEKLGGYEEWLKTRNIKIS